MASIRARKTSGGPRYDVIWRDPATGSQKVKTFDRHKDAKTFTATVEADKARGTYYDLRNPITVVQYAKDWAERQPHRESTAERVESTIRCHIEPTPIGKRRLVEVRRSDVQAWVKGRSEVLAPSTLKITASILASVFLAAVEDGIIPKTPMSNVKAPKDDRRTTPSRTLKPDKVVPLTVAQVAELAGTIRPLCRPMVLTQAGLGLRVGELLALRPRDVDFLRREVHVTAQVHPRRDERVPLKTRRAERTVPLPRIVAEALATHLSEHPAETDDYIFRTPTGRTWRREVYLREFKPAVARAGLPSWVSSHDLRHHYVSVLLDAGESVVTVAERIGDTVDMVTSTYAHMMPNTEDRTRTAVDAAWEASSTAAAVTSV